MDTKEELKGYRCSEKGCQPINVPTDDEVTVLNALKALKERVRDIKKRISILSGDMSERKNEEILKLQVELETLNIEWKGWEKKRDEAARERMILLGHVEP